jgi:AraC-like DNA-binding protein
MRESIIDTDDLGEAEAALSANFGAIRIAATSRDLGTHTRISRAWVGAMCVDDVAYGYHMDFDMEPPERLMLCRVRAGVIHDRLPSGLTKTTGPGQVAAFGACEGVPLTGAVMAADYDLVVIDRHRLSETVAPSGDDSRALRLTGSSPKSAGANQLVVNAIDFLRASLSTCPEIMHEPLLAGPMTRMIAATAVSAFPGTLAEERAPDHRLEHAELVVRRAVSYIDDNAHDDISLADIASAARVVPGALQAMFISQRGSTPMAYVRHVRLHHAHLDLLEGDPEATSVPAIARRWGFASTGRFVMTYRMEFGQTPGATLRGQSRGRHL